MHSKQFSPSNSGANLVLKRVGFLLSPPGNNVFGSSFTVVFDEEVASLLSFRFPSSTTGPTPKEKFHFLPCEISKWLNIDINMFAVSCVFGKIEEKD
ncbi:unnamed protein product [Lathyrus oleraceus]